MISDYVTISGRYLPIPTPTPVPTATPRPCAQGCVYPVEGCEIKGIISRIDGTRLYVLPDDAFYLRRDADVWFCNEDDALLAALDGEWPGHASSEMIFEHHHLSRFQREQVLVSLAGEDVVDGGGQGEGVAMAGMVEQEHQPVAILAVAGA